MSLESGFTDVRALLLRSFPDLDVTPGPSVPQPDDYRYSNAATTFSSSLAFGIRFGICTLQLPVTVSFT
ncbi:hypothetical protein TNCV_4891001 [Trichonephila clavipes]|nr:hypothetical protein TNCV_4891001 [Trichonephila clavipes]